ncbi:MAG: class I SAM-dependent methyltransferase [Oscillospiraceae bacterium]
MKKCIVCGAPLFDEPLFCCDNMPSSAQNIPDAIDVQKDKGIKLNLCQCSGCGLVQFDCEPVSYYKDVIRAGGFSTTMVELRRAQYKHFIDKCNLKGKKIIEVGCGQGEFLNVLTEFDVKSYGIENSEKLVQLAKGKGLNVVNAFADFADTALPNQPFDAFLSFNFLEHQPYPNEMLRCIYNNLTEAAYGLVTVPSLEYILDNEGYYELIRDHIAYYTKESLQFVLEKNGFSVLESTVVNRDTLAVIVQKKPRLHVETLCENYRVLSDELCKFANDIKASGKKLAVWGASHQGFTLLATTGVSKDVSYIIDSAPFKQGKFAPASHLPIVPPSYFFENPVDTVLIVAPGYTAEITDIIREKFGNQVQISVLRSKKLEIL